VWRELCAEDARIAERANQRIAWDRFAASRQDPEIKDRENCTQAESGDPEPEAEAEL
jgi:hypothetical protein